MMIELAELVAGRDQEQARCEQLLADIHEVRQLARDESLRNQSSVDPKASVRLSERRKAESGELQAALMATQKALGETNKAIRAQHNQQRVLKDLSALPSPRPAKSADSNGQKPVPRSELDASTNWPAKPCRGASSSGWRERHRH